MLLDDVGADEVSPLWLASDGTRRREAGQFGDANVARGRARCFHDRVGKCRVWRRPSTLCPAPCATAAGLRRTRSRFADHAGRRARRLPSESAGDADTAGLLDDPRLLWTAVFLRLPVPLLFRTLC